MRYVAALLLIITMACTPLPTINKEPFTVTLQVVADATKEPLQGATVSCNGRVQITGPDGKVVFPGVYEGLLKLYTRKTGYWDAGVAIYKGKDTTMRVALVRKES